MRGTSADATADPTPFRTHRYLMGNSLRSERAQKLGEGCGRVVMRTLRGWLLSAPVPAATATDPPSAAQPAQPACDPAYTP